MRMILVCYWVLHVDCGVDDSAVQSTQKYSTRQRRRLLTARSALHHLHWRRIYHIPSSFSSSLFISIVCARTLCRMYTRGTDVHLTHLLFLTCTAIKHVSCSLGARLKGQNSRPKAKSGEGLGSAVSSPAGFRAEHRPPKGFHYFQSALRMASPDSIILLIVD